MNVWAVLKTAKIENPDQYFDIGMKIAAEGLVMKQDLNVLFDNGLKLVIPVKTGSDFMSNPIHRLSRAGLVLSTLCAGTLIAHAVDAVDFQLSSTWLIAAVGVWYSSDFVKTVSAKLGKARGFPCGVIHDALYSLFSEGYWDYSSFKETVSGEDKKILESRKFADRLLRHLLSTYALEKESFLMKPVVAFGAYIGPRWLGGTAHWKKVSNLIEDQLDAKR